MSSWQARIYLRLRDRGWYRIGDLFEAIETEIPLHLAMRTAMNPARGLSELPTNTAARWSKFLYALSAIGVETSGNPHSFKWQDVVRLRYVEGRVCEDCGGPVIKASWAAGRYRDGARRTACLACEKAAAAIAEAPPPIVEEALKEIIVPPPPPQPGDRIGEAVAYAVLHRLIGQWGPPIKHVPRLKGSEARGPPIFYWTVLEPIRRKPNERAPRRSPNR